MGVTEIPLDMEGLRGYISVLENRIEQLEDIVRERGVVVSGSPASTFAKSLQATETNMPSSCAVGGLPPYTLRRVPDPENLGSGLLAGELEIHDKSLILLLKTAINTYPGINFEDKILVIPSPFQVLVSKLLRLPCSADQSD